ncbi:hypothetical protein Pint_27519 [Pistacia integerrima]|uniref:Uncharacterized protein n=1 Tax=Pistacia integerrima TaxID=434235 RepID=A0ACC0YU55_9ROSI|nr:hypothetical protein Pint_27519 [Pistacia integerrima]
MLLFCSSK